MKPLYNLTIFAAIFCTLICLTACERNISTGSTVYEDGSLDRTIVLSSDADSEIASHNIMGVNKERGWKTVIEPAVPVEEEKDLKYNVTFTKHFKSVDEANTEMNSDTDTLFQIRSSIKNRNRWFFTYMEYSDTYVSLDRFKTIPQEDYFTKEDYAFIDRLPAEGSRITKSDSLYLERLNEKIFDLYGARTIFEALFGDMLSVMREHKVPANWTDSLLRKKENIYQQFGKEFSLTDADLLDDADLLPVADRMKIPLPLEAQEAIQKKKAEIEKRLGFIYWAYSSKYLHSITMPWAVVSSNADSARNNTLYWNPPAIKFLLQDYTMTAHARKVNVWQVSISAMLVLATLGLFIFRKRIG